MVWVLNTEIKAKASVVLQCCDDAKETANIDQGYGRTVVNSDNNYGRPKVGTENGYERTIISVYYTCISLRKDYRVQGP